jgi:hypothetical protein
MRCTGDQPSDLPCLGAVGARRIFFGLERLSVKPLFAVDMKGLDFSREVVGAFEFVRYEINNLEVD